MGGAMEKHIRMRLSQQHLECVRNNKQEFWHRFNTMDETWVQHYDPESKQET